MQEIVIVGAGGQGRVFLDIAMARNALGIGPPVTGFLDDDRTLWGKEFSGVPVLGGVDLLSEMRDRDLGVVIGVGAPELCLRVMRRIREVAPGARFPNLVHPSATVPPTARLGQGVIVGAGVVLVCGNSVGDHTVLLSGSTVGHDSVLGDYCTLSPGVHLAGNVVLGDGVNMGIGSVVIQGVRIGEWSVVGAGAAVTGDLPPNCTAIGVPARMIKTRESGWQNG